uniref:Uncharacterized protein LOC114347142 n=1 Tax=Diabrotica virgifera virgifera TaxID=50390 RepID=A0A6P7H570_DIAVI
NCKEKGHFANKCKKPKVEFTKCKRLGHLEKDCRRKSFQTHVIEQEVDKTYNDAYFFNCTVNGKETKAYVDSGCGAVLICQTDCYELGLKSKPSTTTITGYGGNKIQAIGETEMTIKIDEAEGIVNAVVVPDYVQQIPLMIGQSFLNQPQVLMVVTGKKIRLLSKDGDIAMSLSIQPRKIPLWAKESTVIPPRTVALVNVSSRGVTDDSLYVQGGMRPIPGK